MADLNLPAISERDRIVELSYGGSFSWPAGTALHEEREPLAVLTQLRTDMGDTAFSAQYLQRPVPLEGGMFKPGWIGRSKSFLIMTRIASCCRAGIPRSP